MKRIIITGVAVAAIGISAFFLWPQTPVAPEKRIIEVAAEFKKGQELYQYWCSTCHGSGVGSEGRAQLPGTAALQVKYNGEPPALLEDRTDLSHETIEYFVRNGISIMPHFRKTEISDEELKEISAYLTRPRNTTGP